MKLYDKIAEQLKDTVESLGGDVRIEKKALREGGRGLYPSVVVTIGTLSFHTHRPTLRQCREDVERWLTVHQGG